MGYKGVFRSRAEKLLGNCCGVFDKECFERSKQLNCAREKYKALCPACKLFGNMSMKSRIEFKDAFPIKDTVKLSARYNIGINRVSGAVMKSALFEPEVLENGTFKAEIVMRNFFKWQLKVILRILEDINAGYVTFGSASSRGFGRMRG